MNQFSLLLLVAANWTFGTASPSGQILAGQELHNGSKRIRIVAFGDSTTAPRGGLQVYADALEQMLPARGLEVEIVNAGVGGNTTEAGRTRFAKDVIAHNPDIAIVQFGINDSAIDVWKSPPATQPRLSIGKYRANLEYFIDTLRGRGCKVILMTPNPVRWTSALKQQYGQPPYRPDDPDGFNVVLQTYAEHVRQIAEQKNVPLVDVYAAFQQYGEAENRSIDALLLDGMHPNAQGHRLIAERLIPKIIELSAKPAGHATSSNAVPTLESRTHCGEDASR